MRLEDLDTFRCIAEERNLGRAALALDVSQPAVSMSLKRLESELGFALFIRTPKGVEFTHAGEAFHARIQQVQDNLADAVQEATAIHLGELGTLRVGVSPLYVEHPFLRATELLRQQRPAMRMSVSINLNDVLNKLLHALEIDLSLSALESIDLQGIRTVPLFADDLRIAVRRDHPLAKRQGLRLEDLIAHPWMLPRPGVSARRQVEGRFAEHGLPAPRVALEVSSSVSQLIGLVQRSDLLTIISDRTLNSGAGQGLTTLDFPDGIWRRQVGLMMREGAFVPPLVNRFVDLLREVCAA